MVRQHPFTAMLFDTASDGAREGAWILTRPPSGLRSRVSIVPRFSMIPVNTVSLALTSRSSVQHFAPAAESTRLKPTGSLKSTEVVR